MKSVLLMAVVLAAAVAHGALLHEALTVPRPWAKARTASLINMEEQLSMTFALRRKNMDRLEAILNEVSNPDSARYGDRLSHDEMTALVSPGAEAVAKVVKYLKAHGVSDITVARHQDSINFKATVAQVSKLLDVQFEVYENTVTKQRVSRALGAVHVPADLVSIIEIAAGQRGFPLPPQPRPTQKKLRGPWNMNVTPSLLWQQYNELDFPPTPTGARNIQSFFQAQGQYVEQSDLTQFCKDFFPSSFKGDCKIAKYIGKDSNSQPGVESSLDSQYITATGYGLETWVWSYSGNDFCQDLLSWGQDVFTNEKDGTYPYVISMSYGSQSLPTYCTNDGLNRIAADVMKMGTMGITVVIASGDSGSGEFSRSGWNWGYLGVSFPAEIPYATSVGSTTFENGNSGTERGASFSGGGFSWTFGAQEWQKEAAKAYFANASKLPTNPGSYNASGRGTPDVSALGEAFYVIDGGVPQSVAGTSCSTPTFAGMVARLNNIRLQNNKTLGFLNPLIYKNPQGFTDITSGSNDMNHDGNGWVASAGWDPVTGLGTPNFKELAKIVKAINDRENRGL